MDASFASSCSCLAASGCKISLQASGGSSNSAAVPTINGDDDGAAAAAAADDDDDGDGAPFGQLQLGGMTSRVQLPSATSEPETSESASLLVKVRDNFCIIACEGEG